MKRISFAEYLIRENRFTTDQIHEFTRQAADRGVALEDYLLHENMVTSIDMVRYTAAQYQLPFIITITEKMAQPDILAKVSLRFLREHAIIPLRLEEGTATISLATDQPGKFQPLDEVRMLFAHQPVQIVVAPRATIIEAINQFYPLEGEQQMIAHLAQEEETAPELDFGEIAEEDILGMESEAPIIKLVNHIFYQAVKRGASDIHIEPFEREVHVRYRIDGILYMSMNPPKRTQSAITSRIKIMSNLNIAEKRKPQDGRIQLKIANKAIDVRVSILPVVYGERVVMRLLDKTKTFGQLEVLGLRQRDYDVLIRSVAQPNGIILMTGPTGSGKTSTLYSILSRLNAPQVNIITVEDPVEYQMTGVGQVQVQEKIGVTFAAALRSILRQDPDIIMIGETRDTETAQIAIQASLTGHLVLSTLHTNSAAATITRLIDMGIEPFLIASTLVSVIAQRLVRRLCDACKQEYQPDSTTLALAGISPADVKKLKFFRAVGCEECSQTGYRGRIAIFEIMELSATLARMIVERADTDTLQRQARHDGMSLLIEDGLAKVHAGLTTLEEVLSESAVQENAVQETEVA
jgi:general secretion pathway protein E